MNQARILRDSERIEKIAKLAEAYHSLLSVIGPLLANNIAFEAGIREGLNKFLANTWIYLNDNNKFAVDYYSEEAKKQINGSAEDKGRLIYEHMIPKDIYQKECVAAAKQGKNKSVAEIQDILNKYWFIAIITADEHKKLSKEKMPEDWNHSNIFSRYEKAKIKLTKNLTT